MVLQSLKLHISCFGGQGLERKRVSCRHGMNRTRPSLAHFWHPCAFGVCLTCFLVFTTGSFSSLFLILRYFFVLLPRFAPPSKERYHAGSLNSKLRDRAAPFMVAHSYGFFDYILNYRMHKTDQWNYVGSLTR